MQNIGPYLGEVPPLTSEGDSPFLLTQDVTPVVEHHVGFCFFSCCCRYEIPALELQQMYTSETIAAAAEEAALATLLVLKTEKNQRQKQDENNLTIFNKEYKN